MAKQPQKSAPKATAQNQPAPYPANWARMKPEERQQWLQVNRPGRPSGPVGPAATAPAPSSPAAQPAATALVKMRVALWRVQIGDRPPVECTTQELGETITQEMSAYEEENRPPEPGADQGEEDEEEF